MLGLLVKDLRITLTRKYALLIILFISLIMSLSMEGPFIIGYLTMIALMLAVSTIAYDEMDNGYAFMMTMPFSRKAYVREKYLFCLISALIAWCIGAIIYCGIYLYRNDVSAIMEQLPAQLVLIPFFFVLPAIMIPLQLKLGAERSRIATYIIFGLVAGIIITAKRLFDNADLPLDPEIALDSFSSVLALIAIVAVCLLIAFSSYLCSARIVMKKEF